MTSRARPWHRSSSRDLAAKLTSSWTIGEWPGATSPTVSSQPTRSSAGRSCRRTLNPGADSRLGDRIRSPSRTRPAQCSSVDSPIGCGEVESAMAAGGRCRGPVRQLGRYPGRLRRGREFISSIDRHGCVGSYFSHAAIALRRPTSWIGTSRGTGASRPTNTGRRLTPACRSSSAALRGVAATARPLRVCVRPSEPTRSIPHIVSRQSSARSASTRTGTLSSSS